ncbi:MAG: hypothetical protein RLZ28_866 [Actinomycetota bacterium]
MVGLLNLRQRLRAVLFKRQETINISMAILGFVYLGVYSLQVIFASDGLLARCLDVTSTLIWIIFAIDLIVRWVSSESLLRFIRSSWMEVIALAIPFMRILRVFRLLLALKALRPYLKSRAASTASYIGILLPLTWFTGAVAVMDAESDVSDAVILNFPDALWWSLATITTVGYGDLYPVSTAGKIVAGVLMILGIVLFSAGAGMFASWILAEKKTT